jgi:hypothetical protein
VHSFRALASPIKLFYFSDNLVNEVGKLWRSFKFTVGGPILLADGSVYDASIFTLVAVRVIIIAIFIKNVFSSVVGGNASVFLFR